MANLVVHFEIHASDPERLMTFYAELLGWSFTSFGDAEQPYWVIATGEGAIDNAGAPGHGINGGLTQRPGPAQPARISAAAAWTAFTMPW